MPILIGCRYLAGVLFCDGIGWERMRAFQKGNVDYQLYYLCFGFRKVCFDLRSFKELVYRNFMVGLNKPLDGNNIFITEFIYSK